VVPALIAAALALYRPTVVARLDDGVYDTLLRWMPTRPHSGRVSIVDVDERSLATIGQWPWRRDLVARLVEGIRQRGASRIALDIIFAERDRHGSEGEAMAPGDLALADTLGGGSVVLGYAMTFETNAPQANACIIHPLNLAVVQAREEAGHAPLFQASGTICSLPPLAQAARQSGFLNAAPDADGILRRAPLLIDFRGRVYPSLALRAVSGSEARDATLFVTNVNAAVVQVGDLAVPVDGKGNLLVRYRGKKRTFPYVSAADVLNGRIEANAFNDKIVLVGTTALGTREVVATPLDTLFTGVEVQATIADNLLQRDFIRRQAAGGSLESLLGLILAATIALVVERTRMLWGGVAACAGLAALWFGSASLLSSAGVFMSPLFPTLGVATAFGVMALGKSTIEGRRADTAGEEKLTAQRLMVQTLLSLTETRDAETGRHSRRTQEYARLLARQLSAHPTHRGYLTPERIDLLASLAPLHDIGKVGVPDHILNKPGALTPEELTEMRRHPSYGRDVITRAEQQVGVRDDAILTMAKDIVYTHHERWDGTGYPQGLRGPAIPIEGRLMAVVDVYDAAVARNLYRQPMPHEQVVKFIVRSSGTHFDPAVVEAFVRVADGFKTISQDT
jgi:adenylate cyclase